MGKAALEGLNGIEKVTRSWHNGREINTVTYNPAVITLEDMVAALKAAGTYRGMVESPAAAEKRRYPVRTATGTSAGNDVDY